VIAVEDSYVVHVDNVLFEHLLILEQSVAHAAADLDVPARYLSLARESDVFQKLPVESAEKALGAFRLVRFPAGSSITSMGEAPHTFYVMVSGRAELWRQDADSGLPTKAGELGPGDRFGEDALLTGHEGLEGVKALEDCSLLALSKADFDDLLARPLVPSVSPAVAHTMLEEDACQALDVRYDVEYEMQHIPGAALVMFHELRDRAGELDRAKRHVVYCNGGKLGAAATFTLTRLGFDALNLDGGFQKWRFERAEGMPGEEILPGQEEEDEPVERVPVPDDEPDTAAKDSGEGGGFHSFIVSDNIVRAAYPQLAMALGARRLGRRAAVLFTNAGVSILIGDNAANMGCQIGAAKFAAVMNQFVARTMREEYRERGMLRLDELLKLAIGEGVEIYACRTSLEALEEKEDELIEGVRVIQPERFLSI
jgi:rhodanese-related sulfurtransferase/predicted peroxiredoxin